MSNEGTVFPFSSLGSHIETAFVEASYELEDKFTLVSAKKFLAKHLPDPPPGMPVVDYEKFKVPAGKPSEVEMYEPLIHALEPFLKDGWSLVNTSNSADPLSGFFLGHTIEPDITGYSKKQTATSNLCRSRDMETFIELKFNPSFDAFTTDIDRLENTTGDGRDTRGQVITYLNAMQAAQFRTHGFGVLILGEKCRLLRHTRSGIEVTKRFLYTKTSHLPDFFWRLSHASPAARGIDETFQLANDVPSAVRTLLKVGDGDVRKVRIQNREFYVTEPFTQNHHDPVGRGTRCFVAVDGQTGLKCVLKDIWRVHGYHAEGEVYEKLHANDVRNIPKILAAGDVVNLDGSVGQHSCGSYPDGWHLPEGSTIHKHIHYRIALDVVGEPLTSFKSTYELTQCILNALEAHSDAVIKASVTHRDISVGNILIVRKGDETFGYLIDWEFAKYGDNNDARVGEKTGTRQFMAARLCGETPVARTTGDDLESFLLVMMWTVAGYARNDMGAIERGQYLRQFDEPGSIAKRGLISGAVEELRLRSSYLDGVLYKLKEGWKWRYAGRLREASEEELQKAKDAVDQLESHEWMIIILQAALGDATWKAASLDQAVQQDVVSVMHERRKKRKSQCSEYDMSDNIARKKSQAQ
ncbi:hypothetical protein FIBSPDRAFT_1036388 [Athelia psychrophila]|uniref:Fungal-type protein kinase domain-containing protein n=1 Tax=Athelia psychrophila TaxID=1759441 RepID=A0A166W1A2_9AGAM|nr:hypothetical protein FIBSPDRAFT_1036388 [Fibularhizoctonia sp. CBS 109695]